MAETLPSPNDKTVVVPTNHLCKLWTMTIASLVLNAVIIVLLLVGAIIHHHQMHRGFDDRGDRHFARMMAMNHGWNGYRGFRGEPMGGGRFGGPGPMGGGPAMGGMMGREKSGPPDPARMSDNILNHLSQKLSLTDDEKTKIKPIIDQQVAEIQKQMEAQRASIKKQIEDARAKIKPLLTTDQQKQLDALPLPGEKQGP
jgi:hypothetical protein